MVRDTPGLRYRVYRPAVVVGDSRTGEMDKVDGPYYFFGVLAAMARLPRFTPIALPDTGRTNIVPVDYVAGALVALMQTAGSRRPDVPPHRAAKHRSARDLPRGGARGRTAAGAGPLCPARWRPLPDRPGPRQGVAQHAGHPTRHSRRDPRRRRPGTHVHRREHPGSIARHRNRRARFRLLRACAVAVLGGAPRSGPGPARRCRRPVGRPPRDHHRRLQRYRAGVRDRSGGPRCNGVRAGPQRRRARRTDRRDPHRRRSGSRIRL